MDPCPWAGQTIPQVFALAAAAHPERVAIDDGITPVTYATLSDHAGRVAATLGERLAGTSQHVALLAGPGADAIAGMLGTMIAGHVYVPLDPQDPADRLRALLRDSEACLVLADRANLTRAESIAGGLAVVPLDGLPDGLLVPQIASDPDAAAFLSYTSGSTGRPKGVLHQHRARLHACWEYSRFHHLHSGDRVALLFALSFGASSLVVYGSLLNGATLCLPHLERRGVAALAAWLDAERITVAHSVPTTWRALLTQPVPPEQLRTLRTYDLGGEALFAHDVAAWRARFGSHTRLTTRLAATEVSLITQCEIGEVEGVAGPLPVGPAAPGVHLAILRDDGSPASANEPGELIIHTPYVSLGYWRQPELTASRFADDPERPGWRIYRGGDRGALDEQRRLTVLGRADAEVRVRGYSVHLAEVEAALRCVAGVEDAAVVVADADTSPRGARILAFFTATAPSVDGASVRRALMAVLPRYAVPAEAHRLDVLPMTTTGKVDRLSLARMQRPSADTAGPGAAALDEQERSVAGCVARVLNVPDVGRDDDFFELGGDSMSLAALHVELERLAERTLSPQDLLDTPTVAGFAALLRVPVVTNRAASPVLWPIRRGGDHPPLFLVPGGDGRIVGSQGFLNALGDEQPVWGFRAPTADEHQPPLRTIADMAALYVEAMRRVRPDGPYFLGGVCAGTVVALEMACQLRDGGVPVAPLLLIDPPAFPRDRGAVRYVVGGMLVRLAAVLAAAPASERLLGLLRRVSPGRVRPITAGRFGVWARFRLATYGHVPRPYGGPVQLLTSEQRAEPASRSLRRYVSGDMQVRPAGRSHHDVFDSSNKDAAAALHACATQALEWMEQSRMRQS